MAKPLIDTVLLNARTIVADRRLRLLCAEAVTADGCECDASDDDAQRFCAVGALIRGGNMGRFSPGPIPLRPITTLKASCHV